MLGTREYTLCSPFRANAHNSSYFMEFVSKNCLNKVLKNFSMHVGCQISETRACSVALYISMKLSCITFQIVQHLIETVFAI